MGVTVLKIYMDTIILSQLLVLCSGDSQVSYNTNISDLNHEATAFNVTNENNTEDMTTTKSTFRITTETMGKNTSLNGTDSLIRYGSDGTTQSTPNVIFGNTTRDPSTIPQETYTPYNICDNETVLAEVKDCTKYMPNRYSCHGYCGYKTSSERHCACDVYCLVNNDCCADFAQICPVVAATANETKESVKDRKIKWKCTSTKHDELVKMITTCPESNASCDLDDLDLLEGYMPVFDNNTGLYYLNNYCAKCHNFTEGNLQMPTKVECRFFMKDNLDNMEELQQAIYTERCTLKFDQIGHQCWKYRTTCHQDCDNKTVQTLCKNKPVQMYSTGLNVYKNEYCAICANDWPGFYWYIMNHCNSYSHSRDIIVKGFSFSLLMNINPNKGLTVGYTIDGKKRSFHCDNLTNCNDESVTGYELRNETYVLVYLLKSVKVSIEYIIPGEMVSVLNISSQLISYFSLALGHSDTITNRLEGNVSYSFSKAYDTENNKLKALFVEKFIVKFPVMNNLTFHDFHNTTVDDIIKSTTEESPIKSPEFETLTMCVDLVNFITCYDWLNSTILFQRNNQVKKVDPVEITSLVTIVCLVLSIVCMLIRIILQAFVRIYHTFSGKIQFCFVSSLCVAQILYLIGPLVIDFPSLCKAIGILIHYFFLVSFTWMAIIALDMYLTFRSTLHDSKGWKQVFVYIFISMFLPAIVISVAIALDFVSFVTSFKPFYGIPVSDSSKSMSLVETCQMSNPYATLVFFAGPLGVMIVFNTIMYTLTVLSLRKAWKQTAMVSKRNNCHFYVYIKLFIIMGFTWIFGFIGPFVHEAIEYVFIVLNASQGVFIFISTVCTKAVLNEIKAKCKLPTNSNQHTTLTHTNSAIKTNVTKSTTAQLHNDEVINTTDL